MRVDSAIICRKPATERLDVCFRPKADLRRMSLGHRSHHHPLLSILTFDLHTRSGERRSQSPLVFGLLRLTGVPPDATFTSGADLDARLARCGFQPTGLSPENETPTSPKAGLGVVPRRSVLPHPDHVHGDGTPLPEHFEVDRSAGLQAE